jgi:NAD(P)-dependent dehydrogenase (short-subunit alcohol dehydrogenase family)
VAVGTLEGKTAVVTGGGRGIGRATALHLARSGAATVITGRNEEALRQTQELIARDSGRPAMIKLHDVRDERGARQLADEVATSFGRCDILVNNAAGWLSGTFLEADAKDIDEVVDSIVKGPIFMCRAFWSLLEAASPGHIVNITTLGARQNRSNASPIYIAAKFGLAGFTDSLRRLAVKSGIKVTEILPGSVASELGVDDSTEQIEHRHGLDRYPAAEVAEAVLFAVTRSRAVMIEDIALPSVGDWFQDYVRY